MTSLSRYLLATAATGLLVACSSDSDDTPASEGSGADAGLDAAMGDTMGSEDTGPTMTPGTDQTIEAMSDVRVFWTGWDEGQNARQVDAAVSLPPAEELYESITMNFELSCPDGRCDPWDRYGSFGLVYDAGTDDETYVEISRFITPFGVGSSWSADVTDLRPLLSGDVTVRVFIDTWVGPGSGFGNGWAVDASFDFVGGTPERRAIAAIPVWNLSRVNYGDPAQPLDEQLPAQSVALPEGASSLALRTFITGHGQGNALNCAEFCPQDHTFTVNGEDHTREVWRDDCETTAAPNQQGTWQFPRAGWCPGAITHDWTIDLGDAPDGALDIAWSVSEYENTCRPDADPCAGCAFDNSCEWNDSNHTEPNYQISAMLIAYE